MFYEITIEDYVRVDPKYLGLPKQEAVLQALKEEYTGKISKELGIVIGVIDVLEVGQEKSYQKMVVYGFLQNLRY